MDDDEKLILRLIPPFPLLLLPLGDDSSFLHPAMGVIDAFHSSEPWIERRLLERKKFASEICAYILMCAFMRFFKITRFSSFSSSDFLYHKYGVYLSFFYTLPWATLT